MLNCETFQKFSMKNVVVKDIYSIINDAIASTAVSSTSKKES